jgi:hypothetical protein
MARDVAVVYQGVQIGLEAAGAEGTPVPALIRLQSLGFGQITPQGEGEMYRSEGDKLNTGNTPPGNLHATVPFTGKLTYNELARIYQSALRKVVPIPDGSNGYLWNWYLQRSRQDVKQYMTMEMGNDVTAQRIPYAFVNGYTEETSKLKQSIGGDIIGQWVSDAIQMSTNEQQVLTVSGGPPTSGAGALAGTNPRTGVAFNVTAIPYNATDVQAQARFDAAIGAYNSKVTGGPWPGAPLTVEFRGEFGQINVATMTPTNTFDAGSFAVTTSVPGVAPTETVPVYIAPQSIGVKIVTTAQADLDAAAYFPRSIMVKFDIKGIQEPEFYMNPDAQSYESVLEGAPAISLSLKVGRQDSGIPLLASLTAGTKIWVRTESLGPVIPGGSPSRNRWTRDYCGVVIRPYSPDTEGNGATATWVLENEYDPIWGKSLDVTLVNTVAA